MKIYILAAVSLVATFTINAQVNNTPIIGNKITFGIDGGLSSPGSDFASSYTELTSSQSTIAGSANRGSYYDVYGGFKLFSFIGIMAQYGVNNNSFNTSDLGSGSSASGGYATAEYLAGPYFSISLSKIKIEAKFLGGMVTNNYPALSYNSYGTSVVDAFQKGSGFGYCAGAKIKYMLFGGVLGIGAGLNYVNSDVTYSGWTQTTSGAGGDSQSQSNGSVKMNISLVQATLGVSIDL